MPPKQSANWLPEEDKQLAKSWLKISTDGIRSTGQKRGEFFQRVADDFNTFSSTGIDREPTSVMHRLVCYFPIF
jgi:hypothetical protein